MARFTFFVGKGGVGKTTVSSAYALHRAAQRPRERLLLISTDPAHSLGDVLQSKIKDSPTRLRTAGQLWARELDANRQIKQFLARERDDMLTLLSKGSLFTHDELEPLLDTSLPGMAEVAALLAMHELLASKYDEIVIDTAPMGHAIRLFQMPEHFARFLEVLRTAASRDEVLVQHFGGHVKREPALGRWSQMVKQVERVLSTAGSRLVLVTTPEPFSLNEAVRSAPAFIGEQQRITDIVLNRSVVSTNRCPRCRAQASQTTGARKFLRQHFPNAKVVSGEDPGSPILGAAALRSFGRHIFEARPLPSASRKKPPKFPRAKMEPANWPALKTPLTLTVGKGGVGKTTVSAGLAVHHRQTEKRDTVTICSIDPAPSLDDVFAAKVGDDPGPVLRDRRLLAVEFDAMLSFRQWTEGLRKRLTDAMTSEQRGLHIDLSLDRSFLLALLDVVPPGLDEIFAIFRILDLLRAGGRVVIDMAPSGHALDLLRTPARLLAWTRLLLKTLAAHRAIAMARDAAVEIAALSQNVRELSSMLSDPRRSNIVVVTLPEPLPSLETQRLLGTLRELRAPVCTVIVNRIMVRDSGRCPRCRLAAEWQAFALSGLPKRLGSPDILMSRELDSPVAGKKALHEFTSELWKLK